MSLNNEGRSTTLNVFENLLASLITNDVLIPLLLRELASLIVEERPYFGRWSQQQLLVE